MAKKVLSAPSKLKSKISKPQSLQVLIVEDSESDALLIIRELKKSGHNPLYERVETATAMKKALQEKQWDIILCDYKLPEFNAPSAIALLKETNIDIPLIIVSGAIGEETAVECMRLGAHDYIMKNNLSRLCPAIVRELQEAASRSKRKQAESQREAALEALRESETRYRLLADHMTDTIWLMDMNLSVTYNSPSVAKKRGCTDEEIKQIPLEKHVTPESFNKAMTAFAEEMVKLKADPSYLFERTLELEFCRKDGTKFWSENTFSLIRDENGIPISILGEGRDITERKQAEEKLRKSEEKYRNIIENMQEGYFENDLAGNFTFVNDALCRILGYSREELIGKNSRQFTDEKTAKKIYQVYNKIYRTGEQSKGLEEEYIRKDGAKVFAELSVSLIRDAEGKPIGFRGIARDVTERKQAEETLRASEKNFRRSLDDSSLGVRIVTAEGKTLYVNQATLEIYGYDNIEELKKTPIKAHYTPESYADFQIRNEKRRQGEFGPSKYEISIVRKNGEIRHVQVFRKEVIWNGTKQFQIIYYDVTERKQGEESLRESEKKYRELYDFLPISIFEIDTTGTIISFNPASLETFGYKQEDYKNDMTALQFFTPEDLNRFAENIQMVIDGTSTPGQEYIFLRKDGSTFPGLIYASSIIQANKTVGIRGAIINITERKQAEESLRESEERYKALFDRSLDLVYVIDFEGRFIDANDAALNRLGYTREEIYTLNFTSLLSEDQLPLAIKIIQEIQETGIQRDLAEFRLRHKDGSDLYVETQGSTIISNGIPVAIQAIARDITERKQAEEERKQSFERMRKALGATVQAISITVEMKDPYTSGHQQRVSDLARSMATEMGLSANRQDFIRTASSIHDIGKIVIPSEILSKPTKLTDLEFNLIKTHAQSGYDILKEIEFPWPVANVVLQHHERMDGSGYPQGLKGADILLEARILAVADVVEAISSHRPYRPALGIDLALEEISGNRGILYDADAVDACLKLFREKGYALVLRK